MIKNCLIIIVLQMCLIFEVGSSEEYRFVFEKGNTFLKDGKPYRYVSGTMHYFKVPATLWRDRLTKFRFAGLNAVQTYVEWRLHEPEEGVYDFERDERNLTHFLDTAKQLGLDVILRTGPFIDAERDFGGLPYWLLTKYGANGIGLRTSDPKFLGELDKWYSKLLPIIRPYMHVVSGGPVIAVQVENEYGSFDACDFAYMSYLRDIHSRLLGKDVLLFTTDGGTDERFLMCGKTDNVLATVDFGPDDNARRAFAIQRAHQQFGPAVNSEFYTGWIDHWEEPHSVADAPKVCSALDAILKLNASVNLYPMHGGTNFGFHAGANGLTRETYAPCTTSYDFDAPIDEAGDLTPKFDCVRTVVAKYLQLPSNVTVVRKAPKMSLPSVRLHPAQDIFSLLVDAENKTYSDLPLGFEELGQNDGFVIYSTVLQFGVERDPALLNASMIADRAQVFVDRQYRGTLTRSRNLVTLALERIVRGARIDILVENQGRLCYGSLLNEAKGLGANVTLDGQQLRNWTHVHMFKNWTASVERMMPQSQSAKAFVPTFFAGEFALPAGQVQADDTWLHLPGWWKGVAFLNGFNLGRYWNIGPQFALYVPKHLMRATNNKLVVFEQHFWPSQNASVSFLATRNYDKNNFF